MPYRSSFALKKPGKTLTTADRYAPGRATAAFFRHTA